MVRTLVFVSSDATGQVGVLLPLFDGISPMLGTQDEGEEALLPVLDHSFVSMNFAVGDVGVRLAVDGLGKQAVGLSAAGVEVVLAHASVALDGHAGPGYPLVLAKNAGPAAVVGIVHFEDGHVGELVQLAEGHPGHVQGTHQVDPPAHVGLLVHAPLVRAQLAVWRVPQSGPARLAEPGLSASVRYRARNGGTVTDPVAALVDTDPAPVTLHNLIGVVRGFTQTGSAHLDIVVEGLGAPERGGREPHELGCVEAFVFEGLELILGPAFVL